MLELGLKEFCLKLGLAVMCACNVQLLGLIRQFYRVLLADIMSQEIYNMNTDYEAEPSSMLGLDEYCYFGIIIWLIGW